MSDDTTMADDIDTTPSDATLTIELDKPLKAGGVEYRQLVLKEPTVAQVERSMVKATMHEQMRALISAVAAVPYSALGALPSSAYGQANRFLVTYLNAEEEERGDEDDPKSLTITLAEPIECGGRTFDQITLSEPSLSMLEISSKAGALITQDIELMAMAGMACGANRALIERMRFSDFARGRAFLQGFMKASAPVT